MRRILLLASAAAMLLSASTATAGSAIAVASKIDTEGALFDNMIPPDARRPRDRGPKLPSARPDQYRARRHSRRFRLADRDDIE
jgi:hypothetical protein